MIPKMHSLTGGPGTGKSTQVELLQQEGFVPVSAGSLLRQKAPQDITDRILQGELADNDYTNLLIGQTLDELARNGVDKIILDGYPRVEVQARWLIEDYRVDLKACIFLEASEACLFERLNNRNRADDQAEAIRRRIDIYKQNIGQFLDYYRHRGVLIHEIDAERGVEEIAQDIRKVLKLG